MRRLNVSRKALNVSPKLLNVSLFLLFTAGCLHKTGVGNVPANATPWERVTAYNAVLAQSNNTIEQGTELAAQQKLLPVNVARQVIAFTSDVASTHLQITAILEKGTQVSSNDLASIRNLLSQIQAGGAVLVSSGVIGIKNPRSQQTISEDVKALVSVAQSIIELLPALQSKQ